MTKKVFISYSHKDEDHRIEFGEHLSMMHRKNIIDCWHDRKILAAEDWKGQIDENLEAADIIIFLVSSSFLSSNYCYDIEVKRAMERQEAGTAQIISIVVRPCDWKDCEFAKFQVVPTDAKAISLWENVDAAWLDTIEKIKFHINEFKQKTNTASQKLTSSFTPSQSILSWLSDTEILLTHRKVNRVSLDDVFVIPDIEFKNSDEFVDIKSASHLLKKKEKRNFLISGDEQQGKTSLLKYIFKELLKENFIPIYLDAMEIKKANVEAVLNEKFKLQYENLDIETLKLSGKAVILIDNIDEISLNKKFRGIFLDEINTFTETTFITCHSSYKFMYGDIPAFDEYEQVELLGLGNKKREELAQKWISLGVEQSIDDVELYSKCDELKSRLNIVIKKNIVPPKPIYILMLLQMFEANAQLNLELTSYGHCYQQLIYQSFDKAEISKQNFDKYLNVLTELAWLIFQENEQPNKHKLDSFFSSYNKIYLPVDQNIVLDKLIGHSILCNNGTKVGFKYPYIYYFFVGKKIAESYRDSEKTKNQVIELMTKLHREDVANILIFITHHTKDSWVLSEIKSVLNSLFIDQDVAILDKHQLSFMEDFMRVIPELIMEQREIQSERDKHNEHLDKIEREEETEPMDILANINKTFKGMEIAGQIIRNRHSTLTRESMEELAKTAAFAGLRFLQYFIEISDVAKKEILKLITNHLSEYPNLSDREIEKQAETTYLHLTFGVINGVTRKIASSIGSREALEVYRELEKRIDTPAIYLIRQAIELQFNKSLNTTHLTDCVRKLKDNQVCLRILKEMVVQHIYMFPVDYKEKQQLATLLKISMQGQRWMDYKKVGKG